jgi:hypothetical protein
MMNLVVTNWQRRVRRLLFVALALAAASCGPASESPKSTVPSGEWREFTGSWNAAGARRTIPLGATRKSSIINLGGTMLLAGAARPAVGFRADVIVLTDSENGLVGRAVWTDQRGDQVFSELKGQGTAQRNRIEGKIVGGTGELAGATGTYEFSWHYVIELEDGVVQGSTDDLKGRIRLGQASGAGSTQQ